MFKFLKNFLNVFKVQERVQDWSNIITDEVLQKVFDDWRKRGIDTTLKREQTIEYGRSSTPLYKSNISIVARVIFGEICDSGEYSGNTDITTKRLVALNNANAVARSISNRLRLWGKYKTAREVVLAKSQFDVVAENNNNYISPLTSGYISKNPYLPELWVTCILFAKFLEINPQKELPNIYDINIGPRSYFIDLHWIKPIKYPFYFDKNNRCTIENIETCAKYYKGTNGKFYKLKGKAIAIGKVVYYDYTFI